MLAADFQLILCHTSRCGRCALYYVQKDDPASPPVSDQGNRGNLMTCVLVIVYLMSPLLTSLIKVSSVSSNMIADLLPIKVLRVEVRTCSLLGNYTSCGFFLRD